MNKKLTWRNMPMGALKESLVFGSMMSSLQQEYQSEVEHPNIQDCLSEVIMDAIVLFKPLPGHYPTVI